MLWLESTDRAVRACGRCRRKDVDAVSVRVTDSTLGLSGLQHCAKVWICPVCAATIWAERSVEIGSAAAVHLGHGGTIVFATFTTRHLIVDGLGDLVRHLRAGWRGVTKGRRGMEWRSALSLRGYVRVLEVNVGANGWHPHFHVALLLDPTASVAGALEAMEGAFDRWSASVTSAGGRVPLRRAQDVRVFGPRDGERLAAYLAKSLLGPAEGPAGDAGGRGSRRGPDDGAPADPRRVAGALGRELTQGATKGIRSLVGTVPARALVRMVREDGDADALDRWREYERATRKVRGIEWSRGLRDDLGLGAERDDQAIVDDDRGGEVVCQLTERGLARLIGWPELVPQLRAIWPACGFDGLRKFLDDNGIEYDAWRAER